MRLRPKITPFSLQRQSASDAKSKSDYTKSLAKVTQDSIPVGQFDNDQVTRKLDGWYPSALMKLVFVVWQSSEKRWQASSWDEKCFSKNPSVNVFRLQAMTIPL